MNANPTVEAHESKTDIRRLRKRSRLWRVGRFGVLALATLLTLFALFHLVENWRGQHAWKRYKAQMQAEGAVFELEALAPPEIPDDENFAMTPLLQPLLDLHPPGAEPNGGWESRWRNPEGKARAESILIDDPELNRTSAYLPYPDGAAEEGVALPKQSDWRLGERVPLKDWQAYYSRSKAFPSGPEPGNPADDVLRALSRYDADLAELKRASERPASRFNLEYDAEDPFSILLNHLSVLRNINKVVQLKAIAEIQNGDMDAAFDDVNLMFALADSIENEPFLISHLVRIANLQLALQAVWEGLQDHRWTPEQLMAFQERLGRVDLLAELKRSIKAERAAGAELIERIARQPSLAWMYGDGSELGGAPTAALRLIPRGWWYLEAVNHSRAFDDYMLSALPDTAEGLDVAQVNTRYDALEREMVDLPNVQAFLSHRILMKLLLPALATAVQRSAEAQALNDMATIAVALERYRLANNHHPDSLEALSPEWIDDPPNDPATQQPFHYKRLPSGSYRLWSVGWDQTDDDGQVLYTRQQDDRVRERDAGDWAWPSSGLLLQETE